MFIRNCVKLYVLSQVVFAITFQGKYCCDPHSTYKENLGSDKLNSRLHEFRKSLLQLGFNIGPYSKAVTSL